MAKAPGQAPQSFRSLIKTNGSELRTGADVAEIIIEDDKARGVRLATGDTLWANNILASVPHPNFMNACGPKHLTDGIDAVSKSANEAERGMLPDTPTICVGQRHRLDPSRCPEGKAILWLQIPDALRVVKGDAAGAITGTTWDKTTRDAFADRIEAILAKHIKGFDQIKLARRAYAPADLQGLNMNLVGGDPYGGHCGIDQFFTFRPFPVSRNGSTSVSNLYHIGASTHPGPGLGGGCGYNVAKRLST